MKNSLSGIIDKNRIPAIIYLLWIAFSLTMPVIYLAYNAYYIKPYLPTFIIYYAVSLSVLLFMKIIRFRHLIYSVPLAVIITSIFFRYSVFPELVILGLNRAIIIVLSLTAHYTKASACRRVRTVYINILIIVISAEILLRLVFTLTGMDILKRRNEIVRLRPGSRVNNIIINNEGFPGETPFTENKHRWLFTGDSFGVGIVDYQYNFIHMTGEGFSVTDINLSQPGYSPYDYYHTLNQYINTVEPERVFVILFTGNDISEWNIPENNWSYENMRTVNLARNILMLAIRDMPAEGRLEHSYEELLAIEIRRIVETRQENVDKWDRYRHYLAKITGLAHKNGIKLQYIIIPDRYEVDKGLQDSIVSRLGYSPDFHYAGERTRKILDSLKAGYIDTYDALSKEGADGFAPFNTHIDRSGNRAVYEAIAEYLGNETIDNK